MLRRPDRWPLFFALGAAAAACSGGEPAGPSNAPPAHVAAVASQSVTAAVGSVVPNGLVVKVTDANGRPVASASVAFAVTAGNGSAAPRVVLTDAQGQASATWTLGTVAGSNEVTASVPGVDQAVTFDATGTPGDAQSIALSTTSIRILATTDTAAISARALDSFGNVTSRGPTFTPRDPTLVSVDSTGLVHALRRGASTYVVVTAAAQTDSVLVTVLDVGQSICTGAATPMDLAVGQVLDSASGGGVCIHASSANAEYAFVSYYNSFDGTSGTSVGVKGLGLVPLPLPSANLFPARGGTITRPSVQPDESFEARLRSRERTEWASRASAFQAWRRARPSFDIAPATAPTVPKIGDLLRFNVNANDFCANPDYRTGRVVAITNQAIVVADTANPAGGFTDAEYAAIGTTFDTLSYAVDTKAFGTPTDIDNNGHVIMFFTRAVNELTSQASSTVVLGFFYARDLYPTTATQTQTACVGSNDAEMFYLMVPDTAGVVNGNVRTKQQVIGFTDGTVAHEFQHLINASRRMYVNVNGTLQTPLEERWLDEGLSHVAEELNFFRAAGVQPRQNLGAAAFDDPVFQAAFGTFERNNFLRFSTYLQDPGEQAPIGYTPDDDDLPTRGAIWNYLRYDADHLPDGTESSFWYKLVNTTATGIANLTNVLGVAPNASFRDWAISVYLDDNATGVDPLYQEPSWNLRADFPAYLGSSGYPLLTRTLTNNVTSFVNLTAVGVSFLQFSVAQGQDALLTATTSSGQPLASSVQLAVVRIR